MLNSIQERERELGIREDYSLTDDEGFLIRGSKNIYPFDFWHKFVFFFARYTLFLNFRTLRGVGATGILTLLLPAGGRYKAPRLCFRVLFCAPARRTERERRGVIKKRMYAQVRFLCFPFSFFLSEGGSERRERGSGRTERSRGESSFMQTLSYCVFFK